MATLKKMIIRTGLVVSEKVVVKFIFGKSLFFWYFLDPSSRYPGPAHYL